MDQSSLEIRKHQDNLGNTLNEKDQLLAEVARINERVALLNQVIQQERAFLQGVQFSMEASMAAAQAMATTPGQAIDPAPTDGPSH